MFARQAEDTEIFLRVPFVRYKANDVSSEPLHSRLCISSCDMFDMVNLSLQCEVEDVCVTECVNTDPGTTVCPVLLAIKAHSRSALGWR